MSTGTPTGKALAMRLQIKQLMQRHRIKTEAGSLPLFDPVEHDLIMEGYCSTDDIDGDRVKFGPHSFGPLTRRERSVPILFKHDPAQVAGTLTDLEFDDFGSLMCWCTVHHPMAKRCGAFSVGAVVHSYE